jgi:hypothetical protein
VAHIKEVVEVFFILIIVELATIFSDISSLFIARRLQHKSRLEKDLQRIDK